MIRGSYVNECEEQEMDFACFWNSRSYNCGCMLLSGDSQSLEHQWGDNQDTDSDWDSNCIDYRICSYEHVVSSRAKAGYDG